MSHAVALQAVGDDAPRPVSQAPQQPPEKALRRGGIAPCLHEDVQHNAMLIDGTPKVMQLTVDPQKHLIQVPHVPRCRPPPAKPPDERRAELQAPAANGLVGDDDTAFCQKRLDIPQAQAEHVIQPHGAADDLGGEAVPVIGRELGRHPDSFTHGRLKHQTWLTWQCHVVAALERTCVRLGYPRTIRVDQGSEFISRDLDLWAYANSVTLDFSRPGKPTDNAFIEAFNGRFRA